MGSHALTNATRRHEYFRGMSRLLPVPEVLVSFLELRFLGKMDLLALGGRPQPLKKPSQSQKGHFYVKMNALNDPKTLELTVKIWGRQHGIFVIVCGICRGVDKKQISKWHTWLKKPRKCFTKIKPVVQSPNKVTPCI